MTLIIVMLDTGGAIINVSISPPHHTSPSPHHAQVTMFLTGTPHRRLGLCPGGGCEVSVETETEHVVTMDEAMWRRWRESVRLVQL